MSTKDEYVRLAQAGMDATQIREELNVTRQRVHQLAKQTGVQCLPAPVKAREPRNPARHEYGVTLQPSWSGTASELTVALDLIKRGFFVYVSMARTGPFDILAYSDGKSLRVEAKSVMSQGHGCHYNKDNCDILARVMPNGEIFYSEDPGIVEMKKRFQQE